MDPFPSLVAVACCWLLPSLLWLYQLRPRLARALVVECLATATFKFCAACVTLLAAHGQLDSLRSTAAGLLATWVGIVCLAFPSGGHLNSAVTAGFWAAGQLGALDALLYVGAQIAGCALAMDILRLAAPVHLHSALGPMKPASAETLLMAFVLEVAATALNVFLALSCGVFGTHKAMATATLVVLLVISGKLVLPDGTSMDPSGALYGLRTRACRLCGEHVRLSHLARTALRAVRAPSSRASLSTLRSTGPRLCSELSWRDLSTAACSERRPLQVRNLPNEPVRRTLSQGSTDQVLRCNSDESLHEPR